VSVVAVSVEPVEPVEPKALETAQRFIHTASYFLPVKPVDSEILITEAQFRAHKDGIEAHMTGHRPIVKDCYLIRDNRFIVTIDYERYLEHRRGREGDPLVSLLSTPYWFRVHVYFDIVTGQEFVVLTHGRPKIYDLPVIRLQSESLFNRLPLTNTDNRDKFKRSVREIVHYGVGAICLLYFDGRGAGFGAHAVDRMLTERGQALSSDEAYRMLGVAFDSRDYDACVALLLQHVAPGRMRVAVQAPASIVKKHMLMRALCAAGADVCEWIFLQDVPLDGHPRE